MVLNVTLALSQEWLSLKFVWSPNPNGALPSLVHYRVYTSNPPEISRTSVYLPYRLERGRRPFTRLKSLNHDTFSSFEYIRL